MVIYKPLKLVIGKKVYTFSSKGIYVSVKRYIRFRQKVYSNLEKGIYVFGRRYIVIGQKVYTFSAEGI